MQKSYRFLATVLFLGAYLLSACSGAIPQREGAPQSPSGSSQSTEAVFTGTVEAMGGTQWLISGQQISVDGSTSVDSSIKVGDIVKVEASVAQDGVVFALKIEASRPDSPSANDNTANGNDGNTNDDNANANTNTNDNTNSSNDNSNANVNSNDSMGAEQEAFGVVEAITTNSITVAGVTYSLASFTEFKNLIAVGDQVKIHVIVNADGTLTIREIEKSSGTGFDDGNGNSNDDDSNSNDDDSNSNDDDDNGNSNDDDSNSNDDDSNSNGGDDEDNDNGSNSNDD